MKKLIVFFLFVSSIVFSQEKNKNQIDFKPDFAITIISNHYFGDNYLANGHQNPSIGVQIKSDWLHYNKFSFGFGLEKSTQKVTDYSIGGNIDKTNSNSFFGYLTYHYILNSKFSVNPEISYGGIELRQKNGKKFYGNQNGRIFGLGFNLDYKMNKYYSLYSHIGYNIYSLNTNTSKEFEDYFDKTNTISLSLGIKLY